MRRPMALSALAVLGGSLAVGEALAHGEVHHVMAEPWRAWNLTWDVVGLTAIVLAVYGAGMRRRPRHDAQAIAGDVAFLSGLGLIFVSLASPVEPIAEHSFWMHQIQHLLLRMMGPMLIALAAPQATLLRGLPRRAGGQVVTAIAANWVVRAVVAVLAQPWVATLHFIAALYLWQVPTLHNLSVVNDPVHYLMHGHMLLAGLIFWWFVFDRRQPPQGRPYGLRLFMLWLSILANIPLGAYTTLKGTALYGAYDAVGRLFLDSALTDEVIGGAIIWIPGSMMGVIAALIVIHFWGRAETQRASRGKEQLARGWPEMPETTADLYALQRGRNRRLAFGLATFIIVVFASALSAGLVQVIGQPAA